MESSSTTAVVEKTRSLGGFTDQDMAVGETKLSDLDPSQVVKKYQINSQDTGSPEVQVALLTRRLAILAKHFATQRKQLLQYLRRESVVRYRNTLSALGLRK